MIRRAYPQEAARLTEISFASKRYLQYPAEYFDIWQDELTISKNYIESNEVYTYVSFENIIGYYSLVELSVPQQVNGIVLNTGLWLDHMFLLPHKIGRGFGRELFTHCLGVCTKKNHRRLRILAEPKAHGFYVKMECNYREEFPSTIPGRTTPYFEYRFDNER